MTADSLLAVSIGISTGLAVAVVALGLALLVVVTRSRAERDAVEELRIANEALAERLEAALREIEALTRLLRGTDDGR